MAAACPSQPASASRFSTHGKLEPSDRGIYPVRHQPPQERDHIEKGGLAARVRPDEDVERSERLADVAETAVAQRFDPRDHDAGSFPHPSPSAGASAPLPGPGFAPPRRAAPQILRPPSPPQPAAPQPLPPPSLPPRRGPRSSPRPREAALPWLPPPAADAVPPA